MKHALLSSLLALASAGVLAAPPVVSSQVAASPVDLSPVPQRLPRSVLPEGWQQGVFIEVFVRGYQDSDGDGVGDLRGLIQRLDYLKNLGVRGIWLMPITASADRDHGYATTDYRAIEPQYGTLADFDELIAQAHRRGIGVVMDYVLNHSAAAHPLFQSALADPASPWRDWFVWTQAPYTELKAWDIWGQTPWYTVQDARSAPAAGSKPASAALTAADALPGTPRYFATFGPHMPDFNMRHPAVVAYHADSLRFWLNRGLDGFRLDAVPHLVENNAKDWNDQPESRALTAEYTRLIKSYPQRYVVCEATAEPRVYTRPDICGSAFAFGLEKAIIQAAQGQAQAVPQVADFFKTAPLGMATMLSNHDIFAGQRAWDQFQGDETRYKLAAATYLLLPGTPFIYYGEEIGQAGVAGLPGDEPLRAPMSWTAANTGEGGFSPATTFRPLSPNRASHNAQAQAADPGSLLNFYKAMLALRNGQPALARGDYRHAQAQGQVLAFQRAIKGQRNLVVINYGTDAAALPVQGLKAGTRLEALYPQVGAAQAAQRASTRQPTPTLRADARGQLTLTVPAQSVQVFRLR